MLAECPEHTLTTAPLLQIFFHFGRCLCCLLPVFVNRQPPCLHTNSRHVQLLCQMHHRNHWFGKERALVGEVGAGYSSEVQPHPGFA